MLELKSDLKPRQMISLNDRTRLIVYLANLFTHYKIKKWSINNSERDFRIYKVGEAWTSEDIDKNKNGKYSISIDNPDSGYTAQFVEIIFDSDSEESISVTTGTVITPNKYPYSKFVIPNPKGTR